MEITTQPNLKTEKLKIVLGSLSFELVVVNLLNGKYLIADRYDFDTEYPIVTVPNLEKQTIKTELEEYLLEHNLTNWDLTIEQIDCIAEKISKLNL